VVIRATVRCNGQTGVEMEALTAVSVAALTIYDMAKAVERGMTITDIRLLEKRGGKSGVWERRSGGAREQGSKGARGRGDRSDAWLTGFLMPDPQSLIPDHRRFR